MSDRTPIEWTDATWTPVKGCTRVSPGCGGPGLTGGCYAEIMAARFSKPGQWGEGLAKIVTLPDGTKDHRWTGEVRFDEAELLKPLSWKRPRKIFVCSTADLFHDKVTDKQIDKVFAVMALCPQHTFQVLTKRSARMREYFARPMDQRIGHAVMNLREAHRRATGRNFGWIDPLVIDGHDVLANVWLGVSVEDQQRANERIPDLLNTPAAIRWISAEPLLGPIDLTWIEFPNARGRYECWDALSVGGEPTDDWQCSTACLDWVVAGGESGPGARPMHPDWARSLRDQCAAAGVPFLFKQWGNWLPGEVYSLVDENDVRHGGFTRCDDGFPHPGRPTHWWRGDLWDGDISVNVGKRAAGRLLDGVLHDAYPGTDH